MEESTARFHWLSGAEPTLRPDLLHLIQALSPLGPIGLDTDGLALVSEATVRTLRETGLTHVRIGLHSSQSDAHDWLLGLAGAAKRARRAIRSCLSAGLEVHAQIILSRPTMEHLPETVALLQRLGVRQVHIRRPYLSEAIRDRAVALSPRLGLLEPWLEAALEEARATEIFLHDIPPCVAPQIQLHHFEPEPWVLPEGVVLPSMQASTHCAACPLDSRCPGAPQDYIAHFGSLELASAGPVARDAIKIPQEIPTGATPPPARAGRSPATRLRQLHRQLALGSLHGDPMNGQDAAPIPAQVVVELEGSSREIRQALVRAAQQGSAELVLHSAASDPHPALAELLIDSGRLSFESIILRIPESHLESLGEKKRVALRKIRQVEAIDPF